VVISKYEINFKDSNIEFWKDCFKLYLEKSAMSNADKAGEFADQCLNKLKEKVNGK